jgi:hypothetical protein
MCMHARTRACMQTPPHTRRALCEGLLTKDVCLRLGCCGASARACDLYEIKVTPFFASTHWSALRAGKITPPFIPGMRVCTRVCARVYTCVCVCVCAHTPPHAQTSQWSTHVTLATLSPFQAQTRKRYANCFPPCFIARLHVLFCMPHVLTRPGSLRLLTRAVCEGSAAWGCGRGSRTCWTRSLPTSTHLTRTPCPPTSA